MKTSRKGNSNKVRSAGQKRRRTMRKKYADKLQEHANKRAGRQRKKEKESIVKKSWWEGVKERRAMERKSTAEKLARMAKNGSL